MPCTCTSSVGTRAAARGMARAHAHNDCRRRPSQSKILARKSLAELVSGAKALFRLTGSQCRAPRAVADGTAEDMARWLAGRLSGRLLREKGTTLQAEARREVEELGPPSVVAGPRTRTPTKVMRVGSAGRAYDERPAGGVGGRGASAEDYGTESDEGQGSAGDEAALKTTPRGNGRPAVDSDVGMSGSPRTAVISDCGGGGDGSGLSAEPGGRGLGGEGCGERRWTPRKRRILAESDGEDAPMAGCGGAQSV